MKPAQPPKGRRITPQKIILALVAILLSISHSMAIEVGDLTLLSRLGQPLSAQLQLSGHQQLNAQQLIVKQAPVAIYQRMDAEAPAILSRLAIDVDKQGLVSIKTYQPINEPYLQLILIFQWPEGEIIRKFTLLIDP